MVTVSQQPVIRRICISHTLLHCFLPTSVPVCFLKPTFRSSVQRWVPAYEIWMYKKAAAGNFPIDRERRANLLPLPLFATFVFPPRIQTGMMWWGIWLRELFPEQTWKRFPPPYRTNSACMQSTGRASPRAPRPTLLPQSVFILDILYKLNEETEGKAECLLDCIGASLQSVLLLYRGLYDAHLASCWSYLYTFPNSAVSETHHNMSEYIQSSPGEKWAE